MTLPPLPVQNCAVILAAGEGKRMKSNRPKVLSPVLFQPMLRWVMDAALSAGLQDLCVVTGFQHEKVEEYLAQVCMEGLDLELSLALQSERKGTAHAVQMAHKFLQDHAGGNVLVLNGDAPFLPAQTIADALQQHLKQQNAVTVISAQVANPVGYGRIVRRQADGALEAIIEEKEATEQIRQITEINSGAYWFRIDDLLSVLYSIKNENAQGEYYLPDAIALLLAEGKRADAFPASDPNAILGANDCRQLQELNEIARRKLLDEHLQNGVEIPCMDGVMIAPGVTIGSGTCILPGSILRGDTQIGCECQIGPHTYLADTCVADGLSLVSVVAQNTTIAKAVPPFSSLGHPAPRHPHEMTTARLSTSPNGTLT